MIEVELRKSILEKLDITTKEVTNHKDYDILKNNYALHNEHGRYAMSVFRYYSRLEDLLSDLDKVEIFIRRFHDSKYYEKNDINRLDYMKYHLEVFVHKIHTILDLMKLAINEVYEIGLHEKECNWDNLKNRKELKGSREFQVLENYLKSFKDVINLRHLNTHRGIFVEHGEEEVRAILSLQKSSEHFGLDFEEELMRLMPMHVVKYKISKIKNSRIKFVRDNKAGANYYVKYFITTILIEFEKRYAKKLKEYNS